MSIELTTAIRQGLAENANPEKAAGMRAYMKSAMPYRGVQTPIRRKLVRAALRAHPIATRNAWLGAVLDLWRNAAYREERYAAQDVTGAPQFRAYRTLETLPLYEEMIVSGAWWDLVDDTATHKLRELVDRFPAEMAAAMRVWCTDADLWKRRSSIICQVKRKEATDLALLFDCIEPNLADPDFFIRKAIGWALRDLAWTDLPTVEDYVARNADRLSPLSKREALKNAETIRAGKAR
ncbi:MAG: DNA alkylation repair protein [Chloroflexi bacterium]|nr:DNA alkylation repair protein [Chloroflexota bacterium]